MMSQSFAPEHQREIVGRSRTLLERIDSQDELETGGYADTDVDDVFESWREQFPSEEVFERRLDQLGMTEAECRKTVAANRLAEDEPLPEWMDRLEDLADEIRNSDPEAVTQFDEHFVGNESERPAFASFSTVIARYTKQQISSDVVNEVLTEDAVDAMACWFQRRFHSRFVRILFVEFKTFVASQDRQLAFADPDDFEEPPTDYYEQFRDYLFSGGFEDLCYEYPLFARLLGTQMRQWREHLEEFCRRLRADHEALSEQFAPGESLGSVSELEPLADDTHGDGRAVMKVTFESGVTVVYKPRSVEAGATFYRCLDRLNDHLSVPNFQTPSYVVRENYGWMEWVEHEECTDEDAVERYYERVGSLVCLAYLLEFTDCHYENLTAAGEHPVLLDAETIFHPFFGTDRQPVESGLRAMNDDTVLLSLLLPFEMGSMYDGSTDAPAKMAGIGVSSEKAEHEDVPMPRVEAPNTDVMDIEHEPAPLDRNDNVPKLDGEDQSPEHYVDAVVRGFESTYDTVSDEAVLTDVLDFPDEFESIENRVVYRPTRQYASLIRSLASRKCLSDGARFGVELEELVSRFCLEQIGDPPWEIYDAERSALRRFDPPRFSSETDGKDIYMRGEAIGVEATTPGLERARERLDSTDRSDLRAQLELVRGSLGQRPKSSGFGGTSAPRTSVSDDRLQQAARNLFEDVESAAIRTGEGAYHWASLSPWNEVDRLSLRSADQSLYVGRSGMALFGAGLYRLLGDETYRQFTLDAIEPARQALRLNWNDPSLTNLGGAIGAGALAYGLGTVGELINDRDLLDEAISVGTQIPETAIESDEMYDVVGGSAGTILGLLGLHDKVESDELLAKASRCGDHLLENRVTADNGSRVWRTLSDTPPMTGFAHGVAGIAYALVRLADATGEERYRRAALEALEYESFAFSEEKGNWKDFREGSGREYLDQWCHGRPGIGLARLGSAEYVSDNRVEQDIERALDGFPSSGLHEYDHVCCGNAGQSEFLLEADRRRDRRSGEARELLGGVLERAEDAGYYQTLSETKHHANPTFFHGVAGIGYSMLRVTAPETLPSVLLWE